MLTVLTGCGRKDKPFRQGELGRQTRSFALSAMALASSFSLLFSQSVGGVQAQETKYVWPASRQPVAVNIVSGAGVPGYRPQLATILKQSFDDWTTASGGKVRFVFVDKLDGGQGITCQWFNDRNKLTSTVEDGETVLVPDGQGIYSARINLLTIPPKTMPALTDNYAKRVALHEIGHALGITAHSAASNDIMFGTIFPVDKPCDLTAGDTAALASLYSAQGDSVAHEGEKAELEAPTAAFAGLPPMSDIPPMSDMPPQPPVPPLPAHMKFASTAGKSSAGSSAVKAASVAGVAARPGESQAALALRLNNEAAAALTKGQFEEGRVKLEGASKADPSNQLIAANLGGVYANLASISMMSGNLPQAEIYSRKASALIEKFGNRATLLTVLTSQIAILRMAGKNAEALKVEARVKQLSATK